jgi:hypothetical protein
MQYQEPDREPETLLEEWLRGTDRELGNSGLDSLLGRYAEPLIRRIVTFKLGAASSRDGGGIPRADVEDVCSTAVCTLLARLDRLKSQGGQPAFRSFSGYVAVTAYNACNEYFRAKKPAWLSLAMKLRYLATHSPNLALWESGEGQETCGLERHRGREPVSDLSPLAEARGKLRQTQDPGRLSLAEMVEAILKAADGPLAFEALVDVSADWSGVKETRVQSLDEDAGQGAYRWQQVPDGRPTAETQSIDRSYMMRLWSEICQLTLPHRKALLLNLNDSAGGDIQLFDFLGIATIQQIAVALEIDPMEFAVLWKELPLDDARIARALGVTRQDVANRRSSARKRLARRMQEGGHGS